MGKTPEVLYNERLRRINAAIQLRIPDQIPVMIIDCGVFVHYSGTTWAECMYDIEKAMTGTKKMFLDLQTDAFNGPEIFSPGQAFDRIDFKQIKWPGAQKELNRISGNNTFQFVEPGNTWQGMQDDEYDWFIDDPTDFILRGLWPRFAKELDALRELPLFHLMIGYSSLMGIAQFGLPHVADALQKLIEAGREILIFNQAKAGFVQEMKDQGFPLHSSGSAYAPFDFLGDFLRGTRGIMLDMYRHPRKIKQALEKITPWMIQKGIAAADKFKGFTNIVPLFLHKGAGGLMSNEQYKEFYWPTLKEVVWALVDSGVTPYLITEGRYTDRLPIIKDVPKGKIIIHVEKDVFKAKEILGDIACLSGGVPNSILNVGTPQDVRTSAQKFIDVCGKDGGFIMSTECPVITAKPENLKALVEFTHQYGIY